MRMEGLWKGGEFAQRQQQCGRGMHQAWMVARDAMQQVLA
jgi:hypothetical protein